MKNRHHLDIAHHVLDHEVVDANHNLCGKVDDVEIEVKGSKLKVTAILIGNGPASDRLPELPAWLSRKLFGTGYVRVPWSDVDTITHVIKLKVTVQELDLDEHDGLAFQLISRLPGAWKK